jgi:hypothetical protein
MYKTIHTFKSANDMTQIQGCHLFKARICKSRCSVTQKKNYTLNINGPAKTRRTLVQSVYILSAGHGTLNVIQRPAHHILPDVLEFCSWPQE